MKLSAVTLSVVLANCLCSDVSNDNRELHNRTKRWIVFPKGSSLQLVYCWLISTYGTKDGIFTVGITVGLAWEIPVDLRKAFFERGRELHDAHRRDLHFKIEKFITQQGHDGEDCVKRALCEANNIPRGKKLRFLQAVLYEIFKLDSALDEELECHHSHQCQFSVFNEEFDSPVNEEFDSPVLAM